LMYIMEFHGFGCINMLKPLTIITDTNPVIRDGITDIPANVEIYQMIQITEMYIFMEPLLK